MDVYQLNINIFLHFKFSALRILCKYSLKSDFYGVKKAKNNA